jgi:hypothetical protein
MAQEPVDVTVRALPGIADSENFAFVGKNPVQIGDPTDLAEAARVERRRWSRCLT